VVVSWAWLGSAYLGMEVRNPRRVGIGPLRLTRFRVGCEAGYNPEQHFPPGGGQPGDRAVYGREVEVPRRPGSGEAPAESIEAGLRELVLDAGPDIRKLSRAVTPGLHTIMAAAQAPADWPVDAKAAAILAVIQELVEGLRNPNWRAASLAAFRLPADQYMDPDADTRTGRWRLLAGREGYVGADVKQQIEKYRSYWVGAAAQLAADLQDRLNELNRSVGSWDALRLGAPASPPRSLPISFERTDVLYRFEGYRGTECITYRWLLAHADIDQYEPVGWYYNEPDAPVEILPLANCTLVGPPRVLPQGGRTATLRFAQTVSSGEHYFFAYVTKFNSSQSCRPTILYEVRGLEMRELTVRAQFDSAALPTKVWYYNVEAQSEGWEIPEDGAPEIIPMPANGYVDRTFTFCERGRKYGLRWQWTPTV
jgi:hypothetical protein